MQRLIRHGRAGCGRVSLMAAMGAVLAVSPLCLAGGKSARVARLRDRAADSVLRRHVSDALGVVDPTVVSLAGEAPNNVAAAGLGRVDIALPLDGAVRTLRLERQSVRAAGYRIDIQLADGSLMQVAPGPVRTMRGSVAGIEDSRVAASLGEGGLSARIMLPDGTQYFVEPIQDRVGGAAAGDHAVYRGEDVIPSGGTCATGAAHEVAAAGGAVADAGDGEAIGGVAGGGLFIAELAIDTDFEFFMQSSFQSAPDPVAAVEEHINGIINAVNIQYERDVQIRHAITQIIVRTAEPDPYDIPTRCSVTGALCDSLADCSLGEDCGFLADDVLTAFRNEWFFGPSRTVPRDVAQLFSGRNFAGATLGIAFLGTVCGSSAHYSAVQDVCGDSDCDNFACATDLSAHELGHSWNAIHCPGSPCWQGCPSFTMNCTLTCSNQFRSDTVADIIDFRERRSCLDTGDELRRLILSTEGGVDSVVEGGTLQFTATADFTFSEDQDVTSETFWSVDPPEAGNIDGNGLFTAAEVDGNECATISAAFTFDNQTQRATTTFVVEDLDTGFTILSSDPPDGAIDARQTSEPGGRIRQGWRSIEMSFSGDACLLTAADFVVVVDGGVAAAPSVASLDRIGERTLKVNLSGVIEPGAWTTVTADGLAVALGYLPGDSSADGFADAADVTAMVDALSGNGIQPPIWSLDIDRNGFVGPPDLLRLIDLLNGAANYEAWNGRSLP